MCAASWCIKRQARQFAVCVNVLLIPVCPLVPCCPALQRMNYANVAVCSTYPCTRSNLYGMTPSSRTFASAAERDDALAGIKPLAAAEYNLDEHLMQVGGLGVET